VRLKEVVKKWGTEQWLENDERYCAKLLFINPGYKSSLHWHPRKCETFIVVAGKIWLERRISSGHIMGQSFVPYQSITLEPGVPHRFQAIDEQAVVVECSTKHSDEDVVRIEESTAL